jgi:hypothetical protein
MAKQMDKVIGKRVCNWLALTNLYINTFCGNSFYKW